ncbi:hypothetical protein [Lachnotalea glycerini]|uniref:Uncharacterized protein n=1 Tax=Lachnotalea glycerini TaxID=1763509 RepID=A0A371JH97_9FIRM|nr:hypothetical protein [Lachnotalea glycerini]RDY32121.1 hypothetical protein CG710_006545 [Lachnotalea glycerini]
MKEIFQEFGTAIISIATVVLVIGILMGISVSGKTGLLQIVGESVIKNETDYTSFLDFDAVVNWHNRTKPEVAYIESYGRFFSRMNTEFLVRYYAKDMEGIIYPMDQVILAKLFTDTMFGKVLDIRKADGTSVKNLYSAMNGMILFQKAGVYEVYFQIRDRENIIRVCKISIAVMRGGK